MAPRYTWTVPRHSSSSRQIKLFGEGLLGLANGLNSVFPSPTGALSSTSSLAVQAGGGVDLGLTRHIGLRLIQADRMRTQLPNGAANLQNSLPLGTGFVYRFR